MDIAVLAGSLLVNQEAMRLIKLSLSHLQATNRLEDWLGFAEEDFELCIKPGFPRTGGSYSITMDEPSYSNSSARIKNGKMVLDQ